jgi:hypothetical protein
MKTSKTTTAQAELLAQEQRRKEELETQASIRGLLDDALPEENDNSDSNSVDDLSNKDMLDIIGNVFNTAVDAKIQQFGEKVDNNLVSMQQSQNDIGKAVGKILAGIGVQTARQQHPDFKEYENDINDVLNKYPGMNLEDAYVLAKGSKAGDTPPQNIVATERPNVQHNSIPNQRPNQMNIDRSNQNNSGRTDAKHRSSGIVDFRSMVDAAIEKKVDVKRYPTDERR